MSKYVKNTHVTDTQNWAGQDVAAGEYHEIVDQKVPRWQNNSAFLVDLASGLAVMAKDNSGSKDITDVNSAIDYLKDSAIQEVTTQKEKNDIILKMACGKATSNASGLVQLDILVPGTVGSGDGRFVEGGAAWFATYHIDDHFEVHIVDVDNILGYGAGTQVGSYTETGANSGFYAEPNGTVRVSSMGFFGFVSSGLYLRMEAQSGDSAQDTIYMNIIWGKKDV